MPITEAEKRGARIRDTRKERKLTQAQLSKAGGIKQGSLSDLETGQTVEISGAVLIKLAKALRVRPAWLMFGEEPKEVSMAADLPQDERALLERYRGADERTRLSIMALAEIGTTDAAKYSVEVSISARPGAPLSHHQITIGGAQERAASYQIGPAVQSVTPSVKDS